MKVRVAKRKLAGLTLTEVVVIIAVLAVLVAWLLPALAAAKRNTHPIRCVNNLKQVGLSFRLWAGDNGDSFPMQVSVTNGGTMELNTGRNGWINFLVMSNELGTPKILVCPKDLAHPVPATNFSSQIAERLSYFVGLNPISPQSVLSGDDNFLISGVAVKSGLLVLPTNSPVAWSETRHVRSGQVVLVDGSVQMLTSRQLPVAFFETNPLAIP